MRYKINIEFDSAISFTHRPIFDGVLFGAYARWVLLTQEGRNYYLENLKTPSPEHYNWITNLPILSVFPQPLQIKEHELLSTEGLPIIQKEGLFMSSYLQHEKGVQSTVRFRKRFRQRNSEIAGFGKKKRKVRINNGEFKSYDLPFGLEDIKRGYFVFESDNIRMVKFLMDNVRGVGKKRNRGVGKIASYSITETDLPIIRPKPVLEVPKDFSGELKVIRCAWKPPYFHLPSIEFCEEASF